MLPNSASVRQPALRVDRRAGRWRPTAPAARRARRPPPGRSARGWRGRRRWSVSWREASRSGSSQTRMLYSPAPKTWTAPTPRQARQLVLHLQVRVVRQVEHVVALVRRDQVHDHDEVGRRLLGGDADALHVLRQARQRLRDAVLHLHLRVVEIGAEREGDGQRAARRRRSPARTCRACPRRRSSAARAARPPSRRSTFGLAPGNAARTTTVGGTTPGYSLIGSCNSASSPPTTISTREDDRRRSAG